MAETVFLTGATGLIGRGVIQHIQKITLSEAGKRYRIVAAVRDPEKAHRKLQNCMDGAELEFYPYENSQPIRYTGPVDWLICAAAVTSKTEFTEHPVETFTDNLSGIHACLQYATENPIRGMVFISSSVVYGRCKGEYCREGDVRPVDWRRDPYTMSKMAGEMLCNAYFSEYGVPVKIARMFQVYGEENRGKRGTFLDQCIEAWKNNESIVIDGDGKNIRNMIHVEDAAAAIWDILVKGNPGETYNVGSRKNNISLIEMAKIVSEADPEKSLNVIVKNKSSHEDDRQMADVSKLISLGWQESRGDFASELKRILAGITDADGVPV